jgi:hypothetical protein
MVVGVECMFFDYELREKIRLQKHKKERGRERGVLRDGGN